MEERGMCRYIWSSAFDFQTGRRVRHLTPLSFCRYFLQYLEMFKCILFLSTFLMHRFKLGTMILKNDETAVLVLREVNNSQATVISAACVKQSFLLQPGKVKIPRTWQYRSTDSTSAVCLDYGAHCCSVVGP